MDFSEGLVRFLLWVFVIWFFAKQFILYRRFERRGVYKNQRPGAIKQFYYLRKGWREGKKEFFSEQ